MVAVHANANHVPEALVHRVIVRESKYHPDLIGRGGTIGLMQIKLATARGLGYTGDADGLRDPDTNLAYGVKYLAGAYRAAEGDHDRAVRFYASGYYDVAKRQRLERRETPKDIPNRCSRVHRRKTPSRRRKPPPNRRNRLPSPRSRRGARRSGEAGGLGAAGAGRETEGSRQAEGSGGQTQGSFLKAKTPSRVPSS